MVMTMTTMKILLSSLYGVNTSSHAVYNKLMYNSLLWDFIWFIIEFMTSEVRVVHYLDGK